MTKDDYVQVLAPKLTGPYLLHESLISQPLDFFIILSSYTGLVENTSQANYAAAATFQDAFARWRTSQSFPTRSINLGAIQGAGYLHEKPYALDHLRRSGLEPIPVDHFLALLGYVVSNPIENIEDSQIAHGGVSLTPGSQATVSPLFCHLQKRAAATSPSPDQVERDNSSPPSPDEMLQEAMAVITTTPTPKPSRATKIEAAISRYVSDVVGMPIEDVDPSRSITTHGGDSLVVVEFRNWLRKSLGGHFTMGKNIAKLPLGKLAELAVKHLSKDDGTNGQA